MLINKIFKTIHDNEEIEWECETPYHYWNVTYDIDNKKVNISFIQEFHYDGDNWGEIEKKIYERTIATIEEVDVKEYINFLTHVLNSSDDELEYYYGNVHRKVHYSKI